MTQDQTAYSRATHAALLGLATQLVFAITMAGLGLYAQSSALHAAAWHLFGGLPIWVVLWMLYHQHRLERIETLEAEQLSREDARAAALFDEAGHNLATARKRLEGFYKWGLSAVSVVVAVYLLAAGLALFFGNWNLIDQTEDGRNFTRLLGAALGNPLVNPWMLVGFTALMAFVGFLVSRYIAGMTRVREWQLLRGGAGYLIGNVAVIVLVLIASGLAAGGSATMLAALSLVIPLIMVLLGTETLLAFVFGIYRPRKQDEIVRPAFDSRLLGWLTSPESIGKIVSETLNYQFGFEITKSWFYVLLGRALTPLILAGALILIGFSSVVIVAPNQQAVVTDRGKFVRIADPGVSFKLPWPLGRAEKVDVGRSQQLIIGAYDESQRVQGKAMLWTNEHVEGNVEYLPTAPTRIDDPTLRRDIEESLEGAESYEAPEAGRSTQSPLGGLVSLQAVVSYNISDLQAYAARGAAERPERILEVMAERHLNQVAATRSVDDLLGPGRIEAAEDLLQLIQDDVAAYDLGFNVLGVLFHDVHPPMEGEVANAYLDQVNALVSQKTEIENAQRDAIGILSTAAGSRREALRIEEAIVRLTQLRAQANGSPDGDAPADLEEQVLAQQTLVNRLIDEAGGEASLVLASAREERWSTALAEQAEAARFDFELEAFNKAPEYFKARYYLEAVAEAFASSNRRVISTVPTSEGSTVRLNLENQSSASDLFTGGSD